MKSARKVTHKISPQALAQTLGQSMESRRITFSDLVRLYCLAKPPNSPRDARLKKWLSVLGDRSVSTDVQNVRSIDSAKNDMGAYYPAATYYSKAEFEALGCSNSLP